MPENIQKTNKENPILPNPLEKKNKNKGFPLKWIIALILILALAYYYSWSFNRVKELENKVKILRETVASLKSVLENKGINLTEEGVEIPNLVLEEISKTNQEESQSQQESLASRDNFSKEEALVGSKEIKETLIKNIRLGEHQGFIRVVFDLSPEDLKDVPETKAKLDSKEKTITLEISGLQTDLSKNFAFGKEFSVNLSPLVKITSSALNQNEGKAQYILHLENEKTFRLGSLLNPPRIILDIQK